MIVDVLSITVPTAAILAGNVFNIQTRPSTLATAAVLPLAWVAAINLNRAHEPRFLGLGSEEFRRVLHAAILVVAVVAFASYLAKAEVSRGLVVVGLPLALALNLILRYALRKVVHRQRDLGRFLYRVLLVGDMKGVSDLATRFSRARYTGLAVIGCCLDAGEAVPEQRRSEVPVLGGIEDVLDVVQAHRITALAVSSLPASSGTSVRRLAWDLEGTGVDLMVAPDVTECVGPRIHIRPVDGLPLLHVEDPHLVSAHRLLKAAFDRTAALVGLVALAAPMIVIAIAVRLTSPGPALFRQVRVGAQGRRFTLYKFRSMCADAEARQADLSTCGEARRGPLFKMVNDPRVTGIGAVLRRYSLDELPQLINVLKGDMSLVGPRPPLPSEVAQYGTDVERRLLVTPGLTGLWQVSGRSDLAWDESVRLDLYYVENWSLALDFLILWKTVPAVLRASGAY